MSESTTSPSRSSKGSGFVRVGLVLLETVCRLCNSKLWRQWLVCTTATLTMGLVGTVHGWTKISLVHLTTKSSPVLLTLTQDEYSWVLSLIVLGSVIGSLLATHLADRIGRIYCFLVCSTMFTLGWLIIYFAASVPMLYLAGVTLGIGIGIAYTINPMFVSEVVDIKYRGSIGVLIAANVNSGILLTYCLEMWLTYKSHLAVLALISSLSMLPFMCLRETPYFLVVKGQKVQASKSIAYYKAIQDPDEVKIELRALRKQVRYELHQQSGSDLLSQSGRDLTPQSRSDLPSQSISVIHSEVTCEGHQQPTGEIRLQSSRELHSQSTSEVHRPSTSEMHRSSASETQPEPTSEMHGPSTSQIHRPSTSEIHRPSTSEIHRPSTSEILPQTRSELPSRSRSDLRRQSSGDSRASTGISEPYRDETKYTCLYKLRAILQRSNRKALFLMLGLIMAQQLSGNFTTTEYLGELIERKSTTIDMHEAMILVQAIRHVSGYSAMVIVAWYGRRTLLILSTIGTCASFLTLALYHYLDLHNINDPTISIFSIYFLSWYQVMFQIGLGMLPNVLLCELFPADLKGFVCTIIVIFDGITGFSALKLSQVLTNNIEWYAIFVIFATTCSMAFMIVFIWLPETKGKTYHEIEALLVGENLNSSNEEFSSDEMDIHRI